MQVVHLKDAFQQRIREAEALKLELGRAEETLRAATGVRVARCMDRTTCMPACAANLVCA
jgi:hypothetical protein